MVLIVGMTAEVQTWVAFAVRCGYLSKEEGKALHRTYDAIIGKLLSMITHPEPWLLLEGG